MTSAEDKSIGFEYQYYYFLYLILCLQPGEKIGLEIKDDIHIDSLNGKQILMQLKHTTQTNAQGEAINLRESDTDTWKTLYNWIKVINDSSEGRQDIKSQIAFIESTSFILISNKASNDKNRLLVNIEKFKSGKLTIQTFIEYIKDKIKEENDKVKEEEGNDNSKLYNYQNEILKQKEEWLESFLKQIEFNLNQDDLFTKIKLMIKSKFIQLDYIDDVFNSLDSNIRRDNYIDIKKGKKLLYSFEDLHEKYTRCFLIGKTNRKIIRKSKKPIVEGNPSELTFIKQLEDLEVFVPSDKDYTIQILKRINAQLYAFNNFEQWKQDGELLSLEKERYDEETIYEWEATFDNTYVELKRKLRKGNSQISEDELIDLGNKCLKEVLTKKLSFDETLLDLEMSNGQYYLLSDIPAIGWRYDWNERYKND